MNKRRIPRSLRRSTRRFPNEPRTTGGTNAPFVGRPVGSRNPVTGRRDHWTGYTPSRKTGRTIFWEGRLERDMIELLEADPDILDFHAQAEPLEWSDGLNDYTTRFDFEAVVRDVGHVLYEVKPMAEVVARGLDLLYGFARAWARKKGYADFQLWTDVEIRAAPRLRNALFRTTAGFFGSEEDLIALRYAIRRLGGRATIRQLRLAVADPGASPDQGVNAVRNIARLVAAGEFVLADPTRPYGDDALLVVRG